MVKEEGPHTTEQRKRQTWQRDTVFLPLTPQKGRLYNMTRMRQIKIRSTQTPGTSQQAQDNELKVTGGHSGKVSENGKVTDVKMVVRHQLKGPEGREYQPVEDITQMTRKKHAGAWQMLIGEWFEFRVAQTTSGPCANQF